MQTDWEDEGEDEGEELVELPNSFLLPMSQRFLSTPPKTYTSGRQRSVIVGQMWPTFSIKCLEGEHSYDYCCIQSVLTLVLREALRNAS